MPRQLRKAKPTTQAIAEGRAADKTSSGLMLKPTNQANTRRYEREIPECSDPLLQEAYFKISEGRFKRPGSIKTMQRKNRDPSKCYKAAWLSEHRGFSEYRCLLFPAFVPYRTVRVRFNYRNMGAPEAMLLMTKGMPPSNEMQCAHKCGNGHLSCVNPDHLYWATAKQNARDKVLHDRKTPAVAISDDMRQNVASAPGMYSVIAWEFGLPVSQVEEIKSAFWRCIRLGCEG